MIKEVDFDVTFRSLVGIWDKNYPLSFGNYCGLDNYYCVNMWSENIIEFKKRNPSVSKVKIKVFGEQFAFVIDSRIPEEWRSSFCITGYGESTSKTIKEVLTFSNKSFNNYICGCEKEKESPHLSERFSYNPDGSLKSALNMCYLCGRTWKYLKEE